MSAPWYLEKGQREIVAGRRFEGGAPFNVAGIRGKASAEQAVCCAAGDPNSAVGPSAPPMTPTARAEDALLMVSGLTGRSLSRVSEIRTGSVGSGSSAKRRSVKCVGKPRPNAVSGQRLRFQRQRGERMLRARVRVRETERVAGRAHREARPGQPARAFGAGKARSNERRRVAAVPWEPRARDDPAERVA